jgi:predicted dehydrogenase
MKPVRLAVIGCGAVSEIYHLPAIRRCADARLAAVVDADAERAAAIARANGGALAVADYRELPGKVDAALVATPNGTHAEISCFLLDHGIHVLCEKPVATTLADAERMAAASRRGPAQLMAGHSRRFNPNLELLRTLIQRGHLGQVDELTTALGGRYGAWPQRTDFRRSRSLAGGGVMMDLGIHLIDMALWLVDREATVGRYEASDVMGWGVESDAEVTLEFSGGAHARLACSYTHGLNRALRVRGTEGWAETSVDGFPTVTFFNRRARVCRLAGAQQLVCPEADAYSRQLEHFVSAIVADRPFSVELHHVVAGLRVIQECYRVAQAA